MTSPKAVTRHEKTRADWLLAHEAHWHLCDRRMANDLKRKASQKERAAAGAAESAHHEDRIQPLPLRFISAAEDPKEKFARACFLALVITPSVIIGAGPAIASSQLAYRVVTDRALRQGQVPTARPWLLTGGAAVVVSAIAALVFPSLLAMATLRVYPGLTVAVHWGHVALVYGWIQMAFAMFLTGWEIRRHGWPGVIIRGGAKVPTIPKTTKTSQTLKTPAKVNDGSAPVTSLAARNVPLIPKPRVRNKPLAADDDFIPTFDDFIVDENHNS